MQLDYPIRPPTAIPGMIADWSVGKEILTGINDDAAALPFAIGVTQGTQDRGCVLPTSLTNVLKGITMFEHRGDHFGLPGDGAIPAGEVFPLFRRGRIYVVPEQDVTPNDKVFWRVSPGGTQGGTPGRFRKDADISGTDSHAIEVPNARWWSSGTQDSVVVLNINL